MHRPLVAALLVIALPVAHADEPAGKGCVRIEDGAARLACYDAALGRTSADRASETAATSRTDTATASTGAAAPSAAAATGAATTGAAPAAAPASPASTFGMREARPQPAPETDAHADKELRATVASVSVHPHTGHWAVTLDNGQVWEGLGSANELHQPRAGDSVTIRKSSFGSYLMYDEQRGSSRVRRLQ